MLGLPFENDLDIGSITDPVNLRDNVRLEMADPQRVANFHALQSSKCTKGRRMMAYIKHLHK
jgi:hypothetical protein